MMIIFKLQRNTKLNRILYKAYEFQNLPSFTSQHSFILAIFFLR